MEEKNELNDIILNKGGVPNNNKKIILSVATLGIILIIVVMLMNSLTSSGTDNLPQAVLPPEPKAQESAYNDEPLFEEVEVIQEDLAQSDNLDKIAQKLKEESEAELLEETGKPKIIYTDTLEHAPRKTLPETVAIQKPVEKKPTIAKKHVIAKKPVKVKPTVAKKTVAKSGVVSYVQVGSFSKYEPNKKFLDSILSKGYKYKYHKIMRNSKALNKVLVGPFYGDREVQKALKEIRKSIEPGAFIVKI